MKRRSLWRGVTLLVLGVLAVSPTGAQAPRPQTAPRAPKLEAVAETRLLMEGLAQSNYRGLDRLLKQRPADAETWAFARGQALLLAETGNLLMLRPPRNKDGETAWMNRATDLRENAAALARNLGNRDYQRSLTALDAVRTTCNRCHQTFRVPTRVGPAAAADRGILREAP